VSDEGKSEIEIEESVNEEEAVQDEEEERVVGKELRKRE
jgi:hypothetical protein